MKSFIITIDTEGDNLWDYKKGTPVSTENTKFIPRFQELCEKFGFKPVWLTNYEMICDSLYVEYIKEKQKMGLCEVGIHVHAWNNPPFFNLNACYNGNPYLIEYPREAMIEKFKVTYDLINERIGIPPKSHRAGRWAMNDEYFNLLNQFDIKVDCSYTPFVSWAHTQGETVLGANDYSHICPYEHFIGSVLEVPMSIRRTHKFWGTNLRDKLSCLIKGKNIWLRPACSTYEEMNWLCNAIDNEKKTNYLEFMIHSSELMPGGSPYFKTTQAIEELFLTFEKVFSLVKSKGYVGSTLYEYYQKVNNKKSNIQ